MHLLFQQWKEKGGIQFLASTEDTYNGELLAQ